MSAFDWQHEARRVAAAFGIESFQSHVTGEDTRVFEGRDVQGHSVSWCTICSQNKIYNVSIFEKVETEPFFGIYIKGKKVNLDAVNHQHPFCEVMARGLTRLQHFAAESFPDIVFSAHERLEMQLDFEERLKALET